MNNDKKKIYVLGGSGFLGGGCVEHLRKQGHEALNDRIDITDFVALKNAFEKLKPDVVINFAGVRAYPNIDWCEDHKEETAQVNVAGAINAMNAALLCGAYPIQISSGCVYLGGPEHEFTEEDAPNFYGSYYSRMRIALQLALIDLPVLTIRIRMPLSMQSHPRNTINKIISYSKVISQPNSVTLVEDFYPALEKLIEIKPVGVLNMTNEGYVTHADILAAYKEIVDPNHTYELITPEELEKSITKAKRSNCVLSMEKAKTLGISMPALNKERLKEIMVSFKNSVYK